MRTALLSVVVLLAFTVGARADVDWSSYMEDKGSSERLTKVTGPSKAAAPAPTVTKRAKRVTKPAKNVAKGKARKGSKVKAKKRGRR